MLRFGGFIFLLSAFFALNLAGSAEATTEALWPITCFNQFLQVTGGVPIPSSCMHETSCNATAESRCDAVMVALHELLDLEVEPRPTSQVSPWFAGHLCDPLNRLGSSDFWSPNRNIKCNSMATGLNALDGVSGVTCMGATLFLAPYSSCEPSAAQLNAILAARVAATAVTCGKDQYMESGSVCKSCPENQHQSSTEHKSTTCTCDSGYAGDGCEFSDATTCNGAGVVDAAGHCTCTDPAVGVGPSCAPPPTVLTTDNTTTTADSAPPTVLKTDNTTTTADSAAAGLFSGIFAVAAIAFALL